VRSVLVRGSLTRRDRVVFRCTIEDDASKKSLEVPQWMFDRAVCCGMQLVDTPVLAVCELRALKALLGYASATTGEDLRQNQHCLSRRVKIFITLQLPYSLKFQGVNPMPSTPAQALTSTRTERAR
jgi:hypothetical protein